MLESQARLRIERADLGDHLVELARDRRRKARQVRRGHRSRALSRLASSVAIAGSRRLRSASCSERHSAKQRAKIPVGASSWQRRSTASTVAGSAPRRTASRAKRGREIAGLVEVAEQARARSRASASRRRRPARCLRSSRFQAFVRRSESLVETEVVGAGAGPRRSGHSLRRPTVICSHLIGKEVRGLGIDFADTASTVSVSPLGPVSSEAGAGYHPPIRAADSARSRRRQSVPAPGSASAAAGSPASAAA